MSTTDRWDKRSSDLGLHEADAKALDALMNAGFELTNIENEHQARANHLAGLLGVLDENPGGFDGDLAERVLRSIRVSEEQSMRLGPRDGEALESCVMNGFDPARAPSALRDRADRHGLLREAVTTLSPEGERWVSAGRRMRSEAVLDAVSATGVAPIPFERAGRGRGFRLGDLIAAAAMVLLASAVLLPVTGAMSESGRRTVCLSNLQAAGLGLGLYAMSNDDALPMAAAGFGGSWSNVGDPGRSHSANLFTLVRTKHVPAWLLTCPGNEHAPVEPMSEDAVDWGSIEEVSYSYRLMPRGEGRLDALPSGSVVLADRSPVLLAGMRKKKISPEAASPNHGGEGQHLLRVDESVQWSPTPVLESGDNIWLPRVIEHYVLTVRKKYGLVDGYELPASTEDTFLGP